MNKFLLSLLFACLFIHLKASHKILQDDIVKDAIDDIKEREGQDLDEHDDVSERKGDDVDHNDGTDEDEEAAKAYLLKYDILVSF